MQERVYEFDISEHQLLKKTVTYDPYVDQSITKEEFEKIKLDKYANVIFARQNCILKEGVLFEMDKEKCYLYIKAEDHFFGPAEERLKKDFKSFKRAAPEVEGKVISKIKDEEANSNYGVGMIFGG
jgi:hypothetical protein